EAELRRVSRYSRSLLEASLDPLVTISPEGKITDVNQAAEDATGVPRTALIGTDFASYFTEPERAQAGYRQVFDQGQVTDYALAIRHVSGKITDVLYNASLYRDEKGSVSGVFAAARDVTERKRVEQELAAYRQHLEEMVAQRTGELQTTNKRLEGANAELETFAYSVSHDLRTPLRAVDGFSRILIEDYASKLDAEGQRIVNVIREATKKMAQMIDDILAFSRAGRLQLSMEAIDMEELVREALKSLQPVLAGGNVKVEVQPLPGSHGDASMIQRLWTNLLDNAIKFTRCKPGGVVEVGSQAGANETIYYVKDNGVGFDMQYAHKLFGVFQRLHGPEEFPGTGIGLAIVKRIAERHGGRVWAEGKVGQGATIYFALPNGGKHERERGEES
ncbi:MAG TPA: ATP-binding protein, partial [Bryobacteraceae bacterium]|nr:ATP-binding protein [Bryobacteraceae bacterium]